MQSKIRRAIVTGSFDPVTRGHEDIIRRASLLFDEVYAVVFISHEKPGFFTVEKRLFWLRETAKKFPNVTVDASYGYVADYVREKDIPVIVRGVRDEADFLYEQPMAEYNLRNGGAETLLLYASDTLEGVSSSRVRKALLAGEDPSPLLPSEISAEIAKNFQKFLQDAE